MLLFRSEEWVDRWCERQGSPRGEVLTLGQVWELSKLWYEDRLSPDFRGRSAEQAMAVFGQVGLTSEFWTI